MEIGVNFILDRELYACKQVMRKYKITWYDSNSNAYGFSFFRACDCSKVFLRGKMEKTVAGHDFYDGR